MSHETISKSKLDRVSAILQSEHGVIFFPKREVAIPIIKRESVVATVGEQNTDVAMRAIEGIADYLRGVPIGDQFGAEHDSRRKWRQERYEEFGEAFSMVYERKNQFRINIMVNATSGMEVLDDIARDNNKIDIADNLKMIANKWKLRLSGIDSSTSKRISKPYGTMESYEERLKVVHFGEDRCLEALAIFL